MCVQHLLKTKKRPNMAIIYLVIIALAIASGLSNIAVLQSLGLLISDVFIKIFKCISLPIIALSIIVTLSQYNADAGMKKIWQRTLFYTISTTIIAASVAFLFVHYYCARKYFNVEACYGGDCHDCFVG